MKDFVIYGGGISAKIFALALAKVGFRVSLVADNESSHETNNTNLVTFLSAGSLNYLSSILTSFQALKEFEDIKKITCELEKTDADKGQEITFQKKENILGKIIKNSILEELINNDINKNNNIDIIKKTNLIKVQNFKNKVTISFDNKTELDAKTFVIASLKNNRLFEDLNIEFINKDFFQEALSIKICGVRKNFNSAYQRFTLDGPMAFLPYFKDEASVVWSIKKESKVSKLKDNEIEKIIIQKLNKFIQDVSIKSIERHNLKFRFAKKLYDSKSLVIGNIAHNIHPIAGQGLNLSIKDIALFSKLVSNYSKIGYEINHPMIFEKFDQERKLDNTVYSFGTLAIDEIFSSQNNLINFFSRQGLKLVEKNNFLKKLIVNSATGGNIFRSF